MKRLLFSLLLIGMTENVFSSPIGSERARQMAFSFFSQRGWTQASVPQRAKTPQSTDGTAPYYIFNATRDRGFVVVAGDDALPQVLGYCENTSFSADKAPEALLTLLEQYSRRIAYLQATGTKTQQIDRYKAVAPLLKTAWNQYVPFNGSCPYWAYDDSTVSKERCIVGCVATSLSQVLNYYRQPATIQQDVKGWKTAHYTIPTLKAGTPIDWTNILNDYSNSYSENQAKAVADFSYYCGIVSSMSWGLDASGANMWNLAPSIKRAFGYQYAATYDHFLYSPQRWAALLHHELENGRPIMYAASNVAMTSHAFNVDGCDDNGLYHIEWGYGGIYNGYFDINILEGFEPTTDTTEEGTWEGLFCNQMAIFLHPDSVTKADVDTLQMQPSDVTVDSVSFGRMPDTNGYVRVDFYLHNHLPDTIAYPMEMMLYQPTDTLIFYQADYVGLTGGLLLPNAQTRVTSFCHFDKPGTFVFGYSYDDIHIPYSTNITVTKSPAPASLTFNVNISELTATSVTFSDAVSNAPDAGWSGDVLTYCLFPENSGLDTRHWTFLNVAPSETFIDLKTFRSLLPESTYTLRLRDNAWNVVYEKTFTTPSITGIATSPLAVPNGLQQIYTSAGLPIATYPSTTSLKEIKESLRPGFYIINGKKVIR